MYFSKAWLVCHSTLGILMAYHLFICQFPMTGGCWCIIEVTMSRVQSLATFDLRQGSAHSPRSNLNWVTWIQYLTRWDSLTPSVPWSLKGTPSDFLSRHRQLLTQPVCVQRQSAFSPSSSKREKGFGIGEDCERNIMGRGRRERHLSDGVGMSFIKVLNHASCVCHVFFWFPCVFLLG